MDVGKPAGDVLPNRPELSVLTEDTSKGNQFEVKLVIAETPCFFELDFLPLQDKHGVMQGQMIVLRDITRRKQVELQLNRLVAEQELLLDNIEVHVWYLKDYETYGTVNNAHANFFGLTKSELEHKAIWEFMPSGNEAGVYIKTNNQVFEEKKQIKTEDWLVNSRGESRLLAVTKTPKLGSDGSVEYVICSAVDITERKQAELQINDYSLELELKSIELEELYRHLHEELNKARQLHERTLPGSLPDVKGLSFAAHYQPAERLGSDFYDVIRAGNKLIIYLSDVSGHGLDGAMLSFFIKEAINSYVALKPDDIQPRKVLEHLYQQYGRENYPDDYFIGIFMAVLNLDTKELSYTGAGFQNPPLLHLGNKERLALVSEGLPVATALSMELLDLQENRVILIPGSTVLFATDGIFEQTIGEKQYNDYLINTFYTNSHLPPENLVKAINEDFRRFNNDSLQGVDDITLLVLQVNPLEKK
ncbi:MAG: SpoIIE family protein phosphatase [Bacillota bacterium]